MLGLAEYRIHTAMLKELAIATDKQIVADITPDTTRRQRIALANKYGDVYHTQYRDLLYTGLNDVAINAVDYYADELAIDIDRQLVANRVVDRQYRTKYYAATLAARLVLHKRRIPRFNEKGVSFQQQALTDQRLFLGTATKVEQDIAKELAAEAGIKLIKWTLSHRHTRTDVCDDYASYVSKRAVKFIDDHSLNINPKGVYLVDELPRPPHPNCQCEYGLMQSSGGATTSGLIRRTRNKIKRLLRAIRRKS